eukprot:m.175736 g.175736  ORF g.175736 m.175736 type:complete len:319 (-) comp14622_c0_seq5:167-1123(-)
MSASSHSAATRGGAAATDEKKQLREYFQSHVEGKLLKQMPQDILSQTTPATQLLEKKKELEEVEDALEAQKEDFKVRMESLQQRRAELERKEYQLQENLLKFDRFLKENDARRERAELKTKQETKLADERESEMQALQQRLRLLHEARERQREIIRRYQKFEDFLKRVLQQSGEYEEVFELMDRHATLVATNSDLKEREKRNQKMMDEMKKGAATFKEDTRIFMLKCNNLLAEKQREREIAQTEKLYWENQFAHIQTSASRRTLQLGQIKMATSNLYRLLQRSSSASATPPVKQLEKIQHYIQDLQDITADHAQPSSP